MLQLPNSNEKSRCLSTTVHELFPLKKLFSRILKRGGGSKKPLSKESEQSVGQVICRSDPFAPQFGHWPESE